MADLKAEARKAALARRTEAAALAGPGAAGKLSEVLAGYRGAVISGYMPMRGEIDPLPAMEEAAARGPVCVPVVEGWGRPLRFREWEPGCAMVPGAYGALVPESGGWMVPEVLIVPLVAFTRTGGRLGYGGGFYDRTLAELRAQGPVLALGFAFAAQEVESLPMEETDALLDAVVTENAVLRVDSRT